MQQTIIRGLIMSLLVSATWATGEVRATAASSPSAEQALKLLPMQQGVDFSQPLAGEVGKCTIQAQKINGRVGWIVRDANDLILRQFVDTNGDNVVDQWSYYKDGLEVYRDIDADFNGKADQYRWFHTGGTRWGLDNNQDGRIDAWKIISAEEVTAEVTAALAERDAARFARLVLSPEELKALGLGKQRTEQLAEKTARLTADFRTLAARQQAVTAQTQWQQFGGATPGVVPAGTDGSNKDLWVYENVMAFVETGDAHDEIRIGTLVRVGDSWRVIDLPQVGPEGQAEVASAGFFFQASLVRPEMPAMPETNDESQALLGELEKLDQAADLATTPAQQAKMNAQRVVLLKKIAQAASSPDERAMWLRQLADTVSAAVQMGTYPDGVAQLAALVKDLSAKPSDKDLAAYVKFRQLMAAYTLSLQEPNADFTKIQDQWLKDLGQYVADYPTSPDAAEAMLQTAIAQEFAGEDDEAKRWYGRVVQSFPSSSAAKKAAGARIRLDSVGKNIRLSGQGIDGKSVDLAAQRGKVVVIQYWATWSDPAKRDIAVLKDLVSKYRGKFSVIGVSLDTSRADLTAYLAENRLSWPQIFEEGGLDSDPANQLGILTLPTMILVDAQGKVVNRNVQATELESELKKLIR